MLVKQKVIGVFEENKKTCLQNRPPSRQDHFHPILILPIVGKSSILNVAEFLDLCLWKLRHAEKVFWFPVKTSLFPYYFEMQPLCAFSFTFYSMTGYF